MAWKHGESGNIGGRPRGSKNMVTQDEFVRALKRVEKDRGINLLEHFLKRALKNDSVLIAVMKKLLPDLKALDARLDMLILHNKMTEQEALDVRKKLFGRLENDNEKKLPEVVDSEFIDVNPVSNIIADKILNDDDDDEEQ